MAKTFEQLLEKIGELEGELLETRKQLDALTTEVSLYKQKNEQFSKRSRSLKSLVASLAAQSDLASVYDVSCQGVIQNGWDAAMIVDMKEAAASVVGSAGTTEGQTASLPDTLSKSHLFAHAYTDGVVLNTYVLDEKHAVQLRVLFAADEVVAVPLAIADRVYAYLVACRNGQDAHVRAPETEYLQEVALHVAAAVHTAHLLNGMK